LPGFIGHPVERIDVAQPDFFGGGNGVLVGTPDDDECIVVVAAEVSSETPKFL
jgi:hypothetical protein